MMQQRYDLLSASVNGLITPGVYKLSNGISNPNVVNTIRRKALNSLYFTANLSWQSKLFLDVTGRNDWSSTLPHPPQQFLLRRNQHVRHPDRYVPLAEKQRDRLPESARRMGTDG